VASVNGSAGTGVSDEGASDSSVGVAAGSAVCAGIGASAPAGGSSLVVASGTTRSGAMDIPDDGVGPRNIDVCVVGSVGPQPAIIVRAASNIKTRRYLIVPLTTLFIG